MSFPEKKLATPPVTAPLLPPDTRFYPCAPTEDWECGGIALNDPSQGLRVQDWRAYVEGLQILVESPDVVSPAVLLTLDAPPTEISLAFDQNMAPTLAYISGGVTYLWYYDTQIQQRVTLSFAGATSPRICLDDKRPRQTGNSDVVLLYLLNGGLWYRQQRDRFTIATKLADTTDNTIGRIGMGTNNRVQIELTTT